jgi:hypothetical protein
MAYKPLIINDAQIQTAEVGLELAAASGSMARIFGLGNEAPSGIVGS